MPFQKVEFEFPEGDADEQKNVVEVEDSGEVEIDISGKKTAEDYLGEPVTEAVALSRRAMRVVRQNLAWAICYNLVALPLAATGVLAPWMAALGMSGSSLLVTMNALRVGRVSQPASRPATQSAPASKGTSCKSAGESAA